MYHRHICPSMGVIQRSFVSELAPALNCTSRSFHCSVRRCEDGTSPGSSSPAPNNSAPRETRRTRQARGVQEITGLHNRRPLAGRSLINSVPSGQVSNPNSKGQTSIGLPNGTRPLIRKEVVDSPSRPPGNMVRAPAKLLIKRNAKGNVGGGGPNLQGRRKPATGDTRPAGRRFEPTPKWRDKLAEKAASSRGPTNVPVQDTLSDGMVKQLLRLQRKEWDRVTYEPKYAHGSQAASELIEAGKKLFEGEVPTVKKPGRLERIIGVVGMHGA